MAMLVTCFVGKGFERQQEPTYFGGEQTTAIDRALAGQEIGRLCPWFGPSVTDIRMLRIEENNDLAPALL